MIRKMTQERSLGRSMLKRAAALAVAVAACLAAADTCRAIDSIKLKSGKELAGKIFKISPHTVILQSNAGVDREVPVNEISYIKYEGEPSSLRTAKDAVAGGRYEDALEALARVKSDGLTPTMKQDLDFYNAVCAAELALVGRGDMKKAGSAMIGFVRNNGKSYHYLEACEIVGDLLAAIGRYEMASPYYKQVAAAPWPDYKMRAGVAIGKSLLAQGKTAEAKAAFEKVTSTPASGDAAQVQILNANLGLARCLAAEGKDKEAITLVEKVISKADGEQKQLHAVAYNTLGAAHLKAGRDKEALMAYLHVDLLYFTDPAAHAEALANLAKLWEKLRKTERAAKARSILNTQYRNSRWAKQGG